MGHRFAFNSACKLGHFSSGHLRQKSKTSNQNPNTSTKLSVEMFICVVTLGDSRGSFATNMWRKACKMSAITQNPPATGIPPSSTRWLDMCHVFLSAFGHRPRWASQQPAGHALRCLGFLAAERETFVPHAAVGEHFVWVVVLGGWLGRCGNGALYRMFRLPDFLVRTQ